MNEELSLLRDTASRFQAQQMVPKRERWETEGLVDQASWREHMRRLPLRIFVGGPTLGALPFTRTAR